MKITNFAEWIEAAKAEHRKLYDVDFYLNEKGLERMRAFDQLLGMAAFCVDAGELVEWIDSKEGLDKHEIARLESAHVAGAIKRLRKIAGASAAAKYSEIRILDATKLRSVCISHDWYTRGTNEEYAALFDRLHDEDGSYRNLTAELLAEIAQDIMDHSDIRDCIDITSVMYELANASRTYFDIA